MHALRVARRNKVMFRPRRHVRRKQLGLPGAFRHKAGAFRHEAAALLAGPMPNSGTRRDSV